MKHCCLIDAPPILCVIPYSLPDQQQAIELLAWILELGGCKRHDCLLVASAKIDAETNRVFLDLAAKSFNSASLITTPGNLPDERWPIGPNWMFQTAANWVAQHDKRPFWWNEPDCIPLTEGWLDFIEQEYYRAGKPFMGAVVKGVSKPIVIGDSLNGCAVYPPDTATRFAKIPFNSPEAWDILAGPVTVPNAHHSKCYQYFWGQPGSAPTFRSRHIKGEPANVFTLEQLRHDAVVFHRNKDSTLIPLLRKRRVVKTRGGPPCLIMLGGVGDVLIALCIAKHYFDLHKVPVPFITSIECRGILAGCSYVVPISYQGTDWHSYHEAIAWATPRYDMVYPLHVGEPEIRERPQRSHFCHEQYLHANADGLYGKIPLVFDRRNAAREAELFSKLDNGKPMFLYNLHGKSSPFTYGQQLLTALSKSWGSKLNLVDTSRLKLLHYFDLLGLLDRSIGMISIDTSNIHLMPASTTPYIALVNDTKTPWWSSVPRGNCVLELGYTKVPKSLDQIFATMSSMLYKHPQIEQPAQQPVLVTLASGDMKGVWDVARKSWEPYCERHGYRLIVRDEVKIPNLHPSWSKVQIVLDLLQVHPVVWWIDADTTVAKPELPLPDSNADIAYVSDWNGLCCCMFRATNSAWTRSFLKALLVMGDVRDENQFGQGLGPKWEQNTIKLVMREFPVVNSKIAFFPQGMINDHPNKPKDEAFCHYGARSNQQRIAMMKARHNL